jgi:hypothetical protein
MVAGIQMINTELSLYVENTRDSYSKFDRYLTGDKTPNAASLNRLLAALREHKVEETDIDDVKTLYDLSLWKALQWQAIDDKDEHEILFKMPFDLQKSIAKQNSEKLQLSLKAKIPCDKSVNYIERFSSFEALSALILIIRQEKAQKDKYDDAHIHVAVFRMLTNFFHHPSFQAYFEDVWSYIRNLLIEDEEMVLVKMGLGFWNYSARELKQINDADKKIHDLAKQTKIIEDHTDVPSFNYLYYRSEDRQNLLDAMKLIAHGKKTSMLELDRFFHTYRQIRVNSHNNIERSVYILPLYHQNKILGAFSNLVN